MAFDSAASSDGTAMPSRPPVAPLFDVIVTVATAPFI